MPALADITVKMADGTTNITYTGIVPSAGDKTPAVWRSNSVGGSIGQRPELRVQSASNGDNSARRITINYSYPSLFTDSNTGRVSVDKRLNWSLSASIPVEMTDADLAEAVEQGNNLVAATLVKSSMKSGYSPT
jgi:hypothetical protein